MAAIKPSSVEHVKAAADLVDIASARTQLRKVGSRWTGRCPFHEERTPSFSVNAAEKLFYCFGCGKGGDLITFVRETEGLDFAGAVDWLADRYRIELEYEESSPRAEAGRKRRDRLLALLDQAATFYTRHLWEAAAGETVRAYLRDRGLGEKICREFRLGLSPGGAVLAHKARGKGYTQEELVAAGLVNRRGNDYYSGRLVFPLADARGRVLGFGARRLREDDPIPAKYVNSPESELFRKGSLVYGLDCARQAVAKEDRAVVVEGYTDVIALHQADLRAAVASMGTALTAPQLRELRRLTRHLYLCFDADAAGEAATLRGMELAVGEGFDVNVVTLPPGLDPAEAAEGFEARLANAEGYLGYRVRLEIERAGSKQDAFSRVQELLGAAPPGPEREEVARSASDRLGVGIRLAAGTSEQVTKVQRRVLSAGERLERDALAGCVAHRELVPLLAELAPEHFDSEPHRLLRAHLVSGEPPSREAVELLAELDARASGEGIDEETGRQLLLKLRERQIRRELADARPEQIKELQNALTRIRAAVGEPV
ncbi:MAG TPA: DNA primase [Gaiellaceae bacterium]|nr:DNA primase [Gaiellaceae bacterium]